MSSRGLVPFSAVARSYLGSVGAAVEYSHSLLRCSRAVRENIPLCEAAACCDSLPSPSADRISDFSSAPSAAPANSGSAAFVVCPESQLAPCSTQAGSHSASNRRSCWRRPDRSGTRLAQSEAPVRVAAERRPPELGRSEKKGAQPPIC